MHLCLERDCKFPVYAYALCIIICVVPTSIPTWLWTRIRNGIILCTENWFHILLCYFFIFRCYVCLILYNVNMFVLLCIATFITELYYFVLCKDLIQNFLKLHFAPNFNLKMGRCNKWTSYFRFELEISRAQTRQARECWEEQCTALTNMCNLAVDFLFAVK